MKLTVIIPVHNEVETLDAFLAAVTPVLEQTEHTFEYLFVDDGSKDATFSVLQQKAHTNPRIKVVRLSRNFGKECALLAGFDNAGGDAVLVMDVDLQDPPEVIPDMLAAWREGAKVVLTRRDNRDSDSYWKRSTAGWFYKIYNAMARVKIPDNVSDFCLLDREAVDAFVQLRERCRFNKGLFAWIGYEPVVIPYMRPARTQGESSWPLRKLWSFALDGLTSFSTRPLKLWTYIGSLIAALSFIFGVYVIIRTLVYGVDTPGYASLIAVVSFLGGIQLVSLGVLGEYLARVYSEVKDRPVYLVRQKIGF